MQPEIIWDFQKELINIKNHKVDFSDSNYISKNTYKQREENI